MENQGENTTMESKKKLYQMFYAYQQSMCVYILTRLGIPNLLKYGPYPVETIAEKTSTNVEMLYVILRALAHLGVLEEQPERVFGQTEMSALLVTDEGPSLGHFGTHFIIPSMWQPWQELEDCLHTGEVPFERVNGKSVYQFTKDNPPINDLFNNALTAFTSELADSLLEVYDFSEFNKVMDIGGGLGVLLSRIIKKSGIKGILFDLPQVVEKAPEFLSGQGIASDAVEVVGGDVFGELPKGADAIVMKHFLSLWDKENALKVLSRCKEALPKNGKVILLQTLVPALGDPVECPDGTIPALFAVQLMVANPGGYWRTEQEFKELFTASGFQLEKVVHTRTQLSVMEFSIKNA